MSLQNLRSDLAAEFRSAISAIQHPYDPRAATSTDVQQPDWRSWSWNDGQLAHVAPKGWEFPARMSVKQMWNLWFFGNKDTGIRPYRLINKQHDIKVSDKMRHSRVRKVMEHVVHLVNEAGILPAGVNSISGMSVSAADDVFGIAYANMLSQLYKTKPKRPEDITCGTIYNRLCKYQQRKTSERIRQLN
ncbi:hypothetical protein ON010_g19037 [Phytophthora cinnamomi]|nr:hypothetical protein ON010_g19037 [Phytophthora cinnamomi]